MHTRGRHSAAALSVVTSVDAIQRPSAPDDLTDEQAAEWREVVNRLPADWFGRETMPLLAQYCRHVVSSRRVATLLSSIEADQDFDIGAYDRALKMQERESRAIATLATKMRIAQQSTYDKSKKKPSGLSKRPWEG